VQELRAFPADELLWRHAPGIANSAGNLTLHLEGNLREFIGRQMGGVPFVRERDLEFSTSALSAADLIARIEEVSMLIPQVISTLTDQQLSLDFRSLCWVKRLRPASFSLICRVISTIIWAKSITCAASSPAAAPSSISPASDATR